MQNKLLRAADGVVLWLSILLFGFLTVASMLSTAYFTPNSSYAERPEYRWDLIPLNLLFLAAVVGILYILYKKQIFEKISTKACFLSMENICRSTRISWVCRRFWRFCTG